MLPLDPAVSVVVPTRARVPRLRRLLEALTQQACDGGHEIVVVVDGPDPDSEQYLQALEDPRVRHLVRPARGGPGAARNLGWRDARGRVVAFIDDDCVPAPGWLQQLTAPIATGDASLAQGRTEPLGPALPRDRWTHTITIQEPSGRYETCNIAYERSTLEALGGFDEALPRAGEDADLGLRARDRGTPFAFVADAVVHHERTVQGFDEMLGSRARAADLAGLVQRHPLFRQNLVAGVFWDRRHATLWAAGATTLVASRWRPVAVPLALAAWAAARTRRFPDAPPARRAVLAGGTVLADLWELAHTVGGAVRARTLLL